MQRHSNLLVLSCLLQYCYYSTHPFLLLSNFFYLGLILVKQASYFFSATAVMSSFPLRQRRVRSAFSPHCVGAAARKAVLSPLHLHFNLPPSKVDVGATWQETLNRQAQLSFRRSLGHWETTELEFGPSAWLLILPYINISLSLDLNGRHEEARILIPFFSTVFILFISSRISSCDPGGSQLPYQEFSPYYLAPI